MLRNPVDALYSLHSEVVYWGHEDHDFQNMLDLEESRKLERLQSKESVPVEVFCCRDVVRYAQQVKRYIDVFSRRNIHIIIYDDFKSETLNTYQATLRFLEVNDDFQPDFGVVNANRRVRSKKVQWLLYYSPKSLKKIVKRSVSS